MRSPQTGNEVERAGRKQGRQGLYTHARDSLAGIVWALRGRYPTLHCGGSWGAPARATIVLIFPLVFGY